MIERIGGMRPAAGGLATAGVLLLLNPLYLDEFSVYPGVGWGSLPLFYAALSTLGVLSLGIAGAITIGRIPDVRSIFAVAIVGVVGFGLFDLSLFVLPEIEFELANYATRRLFVSTLVAASFALGAVSRFRSRLSVAAALALPLPAFVILLVDWRFDPILGPALDMLFFLRAEVILGVPYLGFVLLIVAALLGAGWGSLD